MICNDFKTAYIKAYAEKHSKEIISNCADNDKDTLEEMLIFVRNEKGRPEAS